MAGPLAALIGPMLQSMTGAVAAKTAAAGAARVAATEAAGAVAAKTAMSGAAGVSTVAGAANPIKAGLLPKTSFNVVEDPSTVLSAKDLTGMLAGRGGPLPTGTRLPSGGQQVTGAQAAASQLPRADRLPVPPVRNGGVAAQARAAQAAGQPQSPPVQSPPAQSQPVQSPAASQPKGPVQTAADRFRAWREARAANRAEAKSLQTPVTQQVKGMTLPERVQRLTESGNLLSREAVATRTGIEEPSERQVVQESERNEEQERLQRLAKLNKAFEGLSGPLNMAQKALLIFGVGGAIGSGLIAGAKALAAFSKNVIASNERLRRFDPAIAASIAQMERQDLILEARTARSTSGSATTLNNQWMALRDEFQPMRESMATIANGVATIVTVALRVVNFIVQSTPMIQAVEKAASFYNWLTGSGQKENMAYEEFLQNIAQNNWRKPRDFDPGAGNGGNR